MAWHVDALIAPLRYAPPLYGQLHALKFAGARHLGRALGLLLAAELTCRGERADALVPVPLHGARMRARGYNQAAEIARTLAAELGMRVLASAVRREYATAAQSTLGLAGRNVNVAGAFAGTQRCAGLRVAVVDDVVTTAATVNAVARVLRGAGAASVVAFAVARTPRLFATGAGSDAESIVEHDAGEDGAAEPRVVQERAEALRRVARPD